MSPSTLTQVVVLIVLYVAMRPLSSAQLLPSSRTVPTLLVLPLAKPYDSSVLYLGSISKVTLPPGLVVRIVPLGFSTDFG